MYDYFCRKQMGDLTPQEELYENTVRLMAEQQQRKDEEKHTISALERFGKGLKRTRGKHYVSVMAKHPKPQRVLLPKSTRDQYIDAHAPELERPYVCPRAKPKLL